MDKNAKVQSAKPDDAKAKPVEKKSGGCTNCECSKPAASKKA